MKIAFECSSEVRQSIENAGRTEDLVFSPDGRRLAIACYEKDRVLILDASIDSSKNVTFERSLTLCSSSFRRPHGLAWIDDTTIAVANREGAVAVVRIPQANALEVVVHPIELIGESPIDLTHTPGSVAARRPHPSIVELFVCNNYANNVSRHLINPSEGMSLFHSSVAFRDRLNVPDSIAISDSGEWIGVSNHYEHAVFIYRSGDGDRPVGFLKGVAFPHGLRFVPGNDGALLVADAGAPFVHLFVADEDGWEGTRVCVAQIEVLDQETFERGHVNREEGGPKGIALSPDGRLLFATCEFEPLVIFDIETILSSSAPPRRKGTPRPGPSVESLLTTALSENRLALEVAHLATTQRLAEAEQRASAAEHRFEQVLQSRSWKVTAPIRALVRRLGRGMS